MRKVFKMSLVIALGLSLMGCSMGQAKMEEITDTTVISQMDETVKDYVKEYFNVEIPTDLTYDYTASKRFIGTEEDPKAEIHHANVFQAAHKTEEPLAGQLLGYGGILTPDNTSLTGLIINIYPEAGAEVPEIAQEQLITIATDFMKETGLVGADEEVTFSEINAKASSESVTILNFETVSKMYAIGIDLFTSSPVYFEYIVK